MIDELDFIAEHSKADMSKVNMIRVNDKEYVAIDYILEIIEKKKKRVYDKVKHRNLDAWERAYTDAFDELEDVALALKGGEQE